MKIVDCHKCNGEGKIGVFKHVENGICFECGGSGKLEVDDDYISVSEAIAHRRLREKEERALDKKYIEYTKHGFWDKRWQGRWNTASLEYNQYEERKKVVENFEKYSAEIVATCTRIKEGEKGIDIFEVMDELHEKYK